MDHIQEQVKDLRDREESHHKENSERLDRLTEKVILLEATNGMLVKAAWFVFAAIMLTLIGAGMNLIVVKDPAHAVEKTLEAPTRKAEGGGP